MLVVQEVHIPNNCLSNRVFILTLSSERGRRHSFVLFLVAPRLRLTSSSFMSPLPTQYLQRILVSSPTLTDRVMIHSVAEDTINITVGTTTAITSSRQVFCRSNLATTKKSLFCERQKQIYVLLKCFSKFLILRRNYKYRACL